LLPLELFQHSLPLQQKKCLVSVINLLFNFLKAPAKNTVYRGNTLLGVDKKDKSPPPPFLPRNKEAQLAQGGRNVQH